MRITIKGVMASMAVAALASVAVSVTSPGANASTAPLVADWCETNTGCLGGPDNCITINPPGGGSITCYKTVVKPTG